MIKVETRRNAGHALVRLGGTLRRSLMRSTVLIGVDLMVAGVLIAIPGTAAHAQQFWQGDDGTTPGDFNTGANWSGNAVPGAGDEAAFGAVASGITTVNVSAPVSVQELNFVGGAPDYSLTGEAINFGGGLEVRSSSNVSIANALTGTGSVVVNGSGAVVTLSGSNSYSGATTITLGTLEATGGNAIADGSAVTIGNGGTFRVLQDETIGSLASTGGANRNVELTGTLTTGGNNTNTSYSGAISGTGGLTKVGSGTFILSGTNDYTGTTTVNGGILRLSEGEAIGNTSAVVVNGGTLNVEDSETIGTLSGAGGSITLDSGSVLTINQSSTGILASEISGAGNIVKQGSGTLTLSAANDDFDGVFTLAAGQITLANSQALGSGGQGTIANDGTTIDYANGVNIGEPIEINDEVSFNQTGGAATQSGVISGDGTLIKTGNGRLTLSAANTYDGETIIAAGTLEGTSLNAFSDTSNFTISRSGNARLLAAADETIGSLGSSAGLVAGGTVEIASGADLTINQTVDRTFAGAVTGAGQLIKTGSETLSLTGTVGPTGGIAINSGTISIGDGTTTGSLSGDVTVNSGAELAFNAAAGTTSSYAGTVDGGGFVTVLGAGELSLTGRVEADGGLDLRNQADVILATGAAIDVTNQAVQSLLGANASIVSDGLIQSTNAQAIQVLNGSSLQITNLANGEIISDTGTFQAIDIDAGGTATIVNQGEIVSNGNASSILNDGALLTVTNSGQIRGGNRGITSGGSLTLRNLAGGLIVGGDAGSNRDGAVIGGTADVENAGTIRASSGSDGNIGLELAGGGTLINQSGGRIEGGPGEDGDFGYAVVVRGTSDTTVTNQSGGTLVGTGDGALKLQNAQTITVNLQAGSTTIGDIKSFDSGTRNVTIAGSLDGNYVGSDGQDTVTLVTTATLVDPEQVIDAFFGADTFILAGAGTASVDMDKIRGFDVGRKVDSGTFILSDNPSGPSFGSGWSFEGGTVVIGSNEQLGGINGSGPDATLTFDGGALSLAEFATTTSDRNIELAGPGTLDTQNGASLTMSGAIFGAGELTKTGAGVLALSGNNSYNGVTRLQGGTIQLRSNNALGDTGSQTITENGTAIDYGNDISNGDALQVNGQLFLVQNSGGTATQNGVIIGSGATLEKAGSGTLVLAGSNGAAGDFVGQANVNAGTLQVDGIFGDTVSNSTIVNVNAGGALGGNGTIAGSVFVNGGTTNPGASPGTLNIAGNLTYGENSTATFELNQPGTVGGANDLIRVGGSLTLDGTLELITTAGGPVGSGFYRLYEYDVNNAGGVLTGSFDTVTPNTGSIVYNISTTNPGQINLAVTNGEQLMQFWDGGDFGGNGVVDGGDGVWNLADTNWTGAPGEAAINGPWFGGVAVFYDAAGLGGNVTVQGTQNVQGLSFSNGPYTLAGDGIVLNGNTISGANQNISTVFVENGVTGTVASQISGSTGAIVLSKDGAGTLVLSGANTYGGGTLLNQGAIVATNSSAFGSGAISAAGNTRIGYGDGVTIANQVAVNGVVTFEQAGGAAIQSGAVSGTGSITKTGAGRLDFTQLAGTLSGVINAEGTLNAVNTGSVTNGGVAINAGGSATNFQNSGTITGSLASSAGSTFILGNAGTLNLVPGSVSNLAGNDTIDNSGILNALGNTQLAGLERFNNSGTINMSNGDTGDVLTIGGDFVASAGSRLVVDIDLGQGDASTVDKLVVTGNGSGSSTTIQLNNLSGDSLSLITNPIVIADFQGTNTSQGPTATGLPRGLIAYFVSQDAAGDWVLSSRVNSELIGGFAANFSTSQSLIAASLARPSSSFVSAPIQPEANETGYSPWIRGIGGVVNNSSSSTVTNPDGDVSPSQADVGLKYAGVQAGFDIGRFNIENSAWNVNLGVTGGYNSGTADQRSFENKTDFNTAFIGTYLAFSRNNLFGELQARWDYTDFDVLAPDFSDKTITADTKRMSISGSTGYAIEIAEGSSFVPSVGFSYSVLDTSTIRTDLGDLAFDDTTSLFGYLSGTLAKTIIVNDETGALTPFITGTIYNDFGDDTTSFFSDINGATAEIITDNIGTYGEVSLGLNYRGIFDESRFGGLKDLTAGVRADFTMGDELSGAGLTGQLRLQF